MEPDFGAGGQVEVDRACLLAQEAFDSYRETPLEKRAQFRAIGQGILDRRDKLVDRACAETGLPIKPQPIPRFTPTRRVFRMDGIVI
jgi:NADP-dependent aldehyde dehydrogenase